MLIQVPLEQKIGTDATHLVACLLYVRLLRLHICHRELMSVAAHVIHQWDGRDGNAHSGVLRRLHQPGDKVVRID
jgi:hypothetical protein